MLLNAVPAAKLLLGVSLVVPAKTSESLAIGAVFGFQLFAVAQLFPEPPPSHMWMSAWTTLIAIMVTTDPTHRRLIHRECAGKNASLKQCLLRAIIESSLQ
jgi:hypothetical protein